MSDDGANVYHILAFTFAGKNRAKEVKKEIKKERKAAGVKIINAAVVSRNEKGKTKFSETADMSGGQGAAWGAGIMLVLTGGLGGILLGALGGGALAAHKDSGIANEQLQELAEALPNDSSAILVLLQDKEAESMINEMEGFNANVLTITLGDEESGMVDTMVAGDLEIDTSGKEDEEEA